MMITVDWVARRYGVLPSKLLREGDSIDIILANLGITYENHLNERANNKSPQSKHNLSQDQMLKMIEKVKQKQNDNS